MEMKGGQRQASRGRLATGKGPLLATGPTQRAHLLLRSAGAKDLRGRGKGQTGDGAARKPQGALRAAKAIVEPD